MIMMMLMIMNCSRGNGWTTKVVKPYFQQGPLSEIFTFAESEFRLRWMKLYSSDNPYTMAPLVCCYWNFLHENLGGAFVISYKLDLTSHFISSARKQPSSMILYSNQQYLNKNWYNLFWKIFLIPFSKQNMLLQVLLCSLCQCKVHLLLYVPRNPIKSERKLFWKIVYDKSFCHLL